jgi:hypothetical protein
MRIPLFLGFLAVSAYAQQDGRVRAGETPPPPLRGEIHAIGDPMALRSFKDLCVKADAIVEGVVETAASRLMPGPAHVETDFWIAVDRVIKGSADAHKLVVSEMGGTYGELHLIMNYPLLQTGQRYVLFLYADKRLGVPPIPGLPRFNAEIFYGTFIVDGGTIRPIIVRSPLLEKYTGMTPDEFAIAIAAELKP